jgi:hypothetical protein
VLQVFHPSFDGVYRPKRIARDLAGRIAARVMAAGLFPTASERRNRYEIVSQSDQGVTFRAGDFLTGIYVGLNRVVVNVDAAAGVARYRVSFPTWAAYSFGLSGFIALVVGVVLMLPLFTGSGSPFVDYSPAVLIGAGLPVVLLLGVALPLAHIAVHKRAARQALVRILDEVNDPGDVEDTDGH